MKKKWTNGKKGHDSKYIREALLSFGVNRWGIGKANSVGPSAEMVHECAPASYEEWVKYYFAHAEQKRKRGGAKITKEHIRLFGEKLYHCLTEVVAKELASISEAECIDYVYNLVVDRIYEGYRTEKETIRRQLARTLACDIEEAPEEWSRNYSVDFFIRVGSSIIGIQIMVISSKLSIDYGQRMEQCRRNHAKFENKQGGKVFFVYSVREQGARVIANKEMVGKIGEEMERLKELG